MHDLFYFLNEYIYDKSKDEIEKIKKIDERIKNNLKENKKISNLDILCLSCYEPLTNFSWSNKIEFSEQDVKMALLLSKTNGKKPPLCCAFCNASFS